ncbi:MAG: hypothetical protein JWM99_4299, partial [Verrucomicrobiales bacterium]|nr:hypothetical protein [Verrucomicrobiales bacterium]
ITAVFEPEVDGTVHLPIPEELRGGRIRVTATLEAVVPIPDPKPTADNEMLHRRREAFEKLRQLNPFREISDPVTWQKDIRTDRSTPNRE